jgi:glucose-1-phosphate thymidylyltransferase
MKAWYDDKNLKCIVLCAGRGSRTRGFTLKWRNLSDLNSISFLSNLMRKPKPLFTVHKKPLLYWIVNYWKQYTNDFIFVVGYKKEKIIKYVKTLPINATFVEQKKLGGIANAIDHVKEHIQDKFIVVLGDCICKGKFNFPENMEHGIGVWQTNDIEDIKRSYSVEHKNGLVYRLVEKPKELPNNLCGMGFYFFNRKVFDYIEKTPPSSLRNEIEIADVIQNMIKSGEKVSSVFFEGQYLNITYPEDIGRAEIFLDK